MELILPIKGLPSLKVIQIYDKYPYISQGFGENPQIYKQFGLDGHNGWDIAAPKMTPVYAVADGMVQFTADKNGYGNYARTYTKEGAYTYEFIYGHFDSFEGRNREVKQGDVIGYVDSTGFSTGHHLHFGYKISLRGTVQNYNNGYFGSLDPAELYKYMNSTKIVLSKDGKTVYKAVPIATDFENFKKQASVEGIEVPNPIPPASEL